MPAMPATKKTIKRSTRSNKRTKPSDEVVNFQVKRHHIYAAFIPVAFILGLAIGYFVYGRAAYLLGLGEVAPTSIPVAAISSQPTSAPAVEAEDNGTQRVDIPIDRNDPVLGTEDAPITIIEFADFQCPYCQRHVLETYPLLLEDFGDQIRYVYKDFPLTRIHAQALPAALAAQCAQEQGMFWEYHDLLFSGRMELGDEAYLAYADELGMDAATFSACYEEGRYTDLVQADYDLAVQLGVNATPTFFVNGIRVVGAQPYSVFANLIEYELENQTN
jgi:protein-disulfide isomerase